MPSVLGYSTPEELEAAPRTIPENTDPRGLTNLEMVRLLDYEEQLAEQQKQVQEQYASEMGFGFLHHMGQAIVQESGVVAAAIKSAEFTSPYDPDYGFKEVERDIEVFAKDLPEWAKADLRRAKSPDHFIKLYNKVKGQEVYNKEAEYLGGAAMAAEIGAAFLMPETYLLGAGETALTAKFALTGAKKFGFLGGVSALSNMGQELVLMENDKSRGHLGLVMAGTMGFGFGGLTGMIPVGKHLDEEAKLFKTAAKDIEGSIKADVDATLSDAPRAQKAVPESVGAAAAIEPTLKTGLDALREKIPFLRTPVRRIKSRRPKFMQSLGTSGMNSENSVERQLYANMVEFAPGIGGKDVARHSAFLRAERNTMKLRSAFHIERQDGWHEWRNHLKKTGEWKSSRISEADFDYEVFAEIERRYNGTATPADTHPSIIKVADARMNVDEMRFKMLKDSGVADYKDIEYVPGLISHQWDSANMHRVARMLRDNGYNPKEFIVNLLKKAILNGKEFDRVKKYEKLRKAGKFNDAFKERTATYQAQAIYDRFIKRPVRAGTTHATLLTKKDRTRLEEAVAKLTDDPAEYKNIMKSLDPGDRRAVDETLSQIRLDATTEIDGFAAMDMLDTTMGRNLDTKFRRDGGRAAMAQTGIDSEQTYLEIKEAIIAEELNLRGGSGVKDVQKFADKKADEILALYRLVLGENIEKNPGNAGARVGRGLRQLATLSSMNQVGFAQTAEMGRLASTIGVRGMLSSIAEFNNLRRNMITGKLKDPMLRDWEAAAAVRLGDNHLLEHPNLRADAGGHTLAHEDSPEFLKMIDSAMQKGLHVQGYINGMNMILRYQHRMHAKGTLMRMYDELLVKGIDKVPGRRLRRYADMGLSKTDLEKAADQMRKHSSDTTGWFGQRRLENLNLVDWDSDIREKIILAMHKNQSQAIQRNLAGETPLWMESSFGKILTQFKTFPIVAMEKQLIHDMKHFDPEAAMTAIYSLGIASTMYMVSTYANSFGLSKRKRRKFLKNRLTPQAIAQGSINWSGQASIIPDAMNAGGHLFGVNPFQYTNSKGMGFRRAGNLSLGAVGAGPNMINSAYRFASGLGHAALTGEELTASTLRHGTRLIPFNNALVLRNIGNLALRSFE